MSLDTVPWATEDEEQAFLFDWVELNLGRIPELGLLFHIPNGGARLKSEAARFKRLGVKAGVPDLFLPVARKGCHGLFIEMKRKRGGKTSPAQRKWLDDLFLQGYLAVRCDGAEEACAVLENYFGL